jgi:hypothetical protein
MSLVKRLKATKGNLNLPTQVGQRCGAVYHPDHELNVLERTAIESDSLVD